MDAGRALIAIDTNLLIHAHRSALPEHRAAGRAIEQASRDPRGWGIALPSVSEFSGDRHAPPEPRWSVDGAAGSRFSGNR